MGAGNRTEIPMFFTQNRPGSCVFLQERRDRQRIQQKQLHAKK